MVLIVGASLSQAFHGALHRDDVGVAVRALRALGLLMSKSAHNRHHET